MKPIDSRILEFARMSLAPFAEMVGEADGCESDPFVFTTRGGRVGLRAHVYRRFNGTYVLRIDAKLPAKAARGDIRRRLFDMTQWMPFCSLRVDESTMWHPDGRPGVFLTHSILVDLGENEDDDTEARHHMMFSIEQALGSIAHTWERAKEMIANAPAVDSTAGDLDDSPCADEDVDGIEDAGDDVDKNDPVDEIEDDEEAEEDDINMTTEQVFAELDKLVGLDPVKSIARGLAARQRLENLRRQAGMKGLVPSPHLVFTGNPGTGKTTVARLIGQLYKSLGMLPSGHLVEANRSTLVAGYVGQTALKTRQICEQAKGGVLFIDEAYSLAGEHAYDYGREAIEELLTFMENNRGKIAVVVAGYPDEMAKFMNMNPGLKSRFDVTIPFPDYSNTELLKIFNVIARENQYTTARVQNAVRYIIESLPREHGFGNAREMRKLFGEILDEHAIRVGKLDKPALRHLLELAPKDCIPAMRRVRRAVDADAESADPRPLANAGYL